VYGFGSGVGFLLAIVALASVRYRLRYSNIPPRLRGVAMAMLLTGLLSMAFMAFSGIDL
jgi:Na+-transporting NADH:ubiquinone oxidoreductase subunit E